MLDIAPQVNQQSQLQINAEPEFIIEKRKEC